MKLQIEMRYRAKANETIEDRHNFLMKSLGKINPPWGLNGVVTAPDIGEDLSASCDISHLLGEGIEGEINYIFRDPQYLQDKAQYDDTLFIFFNTEEIDYVNLVHHIFPEYIEAFLPYRAAILDEEIALDDWDNIRDLSQQTSKDIDGRDSVYRIFSVQYYDAELCRRAFSLSPYEITQRLNGKVEAATLLFNGLLLIYSSELLQRQELEKVDSAVRPYIQGSLT